MFHQPSTDMFWEIFLGVAPPIVWEVLIAFAIGIPFCAILILCVRGMRMGLAFGSANSSFCGKSNSVRYRGKAVLSAWEQRAIKTLMDQLSPGLHLCPQVRLADIVNVQSGDRAAWRSAFNRIACKSVDFVVMHLETGTPIMVIELDDRSHSRSDRQERDALVNEVLRQASIPLVRFKPSGRLDIRPHLNATT